MRFSMRLRLCRAVFCTCCLMPTALIGGAAVIVHTPAYQAARTTAWQSRLAARLGLEVHVTEIDWGDRGDLVIRGIELRDPESHDWLARARSATVLHDRARTGCIARSAGARFPETAAAGGRLA